MSHFGTYTQPRRPAQRSSLTSATLPRPSSEDFDRVFLSASTSPSSSLPQSYSTLPQSNGHGSSNSLTSKILNTAGQTGSTQNLHLLLKDALTLSEKLDSVSTKVGTGSTGRSLSSRDYHTLTARASVTSLPHSSSSASSNGSLHKSSSEELLNPAPRRGSGGVQFPRINDSPSLSEALATPLRKAPPTSKLNNGAPSPPLPFSSSFTTLPPRSVSPIPPRHPSPLLVHQTSSPDYDIPRSPSVPLAQRQASQDNVDTGLDCIAQLEQLERELHSFTPTSYPQRNSRRESEASDKEEERYEMAPDFVSSNKPPPPSQRSGGRPSVADFVDELTEVEDQVRRSPGGHRSPRDRGLTASTATRELDELMANLSNFEPSSGKGEASVTAAEDRKSKSAMDNLNSMLGSLDEDMTRRHGVQTTPKGVCAACNKPILTNIINALGCQWHKEHFTCSQCDIELGSSTYYENNGKPYCEKDYHELFAPRCAYCNGPVLERVLRALGKTWHKEHFFCHLCGKDFGPEGFHEKDGKAFCRECYYEKFAPHCKRCDKSIMEGFITALNSQWHPECFSCKVCGVTFPRGNYFEHEGEPHCEIHYHASRGTLCASCQKPVTGKCITAMGKKWHPEHFTCAFCLKLLNKGTFKEHRHNPYCQPCFIKLFG